MKKLLTIAITAVMMGAFLTGCGTAKKPVVKNTKIESAVPKDLQGSGADVANQPTKDSSGQALTEKERQDMADGAKAKAMAEVFNKELIGLMYNINPNTIENNFKAMNSKSIIKGGIYGTETDKVKGQIGKDTIVFIKYNIVSFENGKEYSVDGKTYSGVDETILVNYTEQGKSVVDELKLTLLYNFKGDKSFVISAISMHTQK